MPNAFLVLAHRPVRAFFAYHDALMEKEAYRTSPLRQGLEQDQGSATILSLEEFFSMEP